MINLQRSACLAKGPGYTIMELGNLCLMAINLYPTNYGRVSKPADKIVKHGSGVRHTLCNS